MRLSLQEEAQIYRNAGYRVVSQRCDSLMLTDVRRFAKAHFVMLRVLLFPLAYLLLGWVVKRSSCAVHLRVTVEGEIKADGYTLSKMTLDELRHRLFVDTAVVLIAGSIGIIGVGYIVGLLGN